MTIISPSSIKKKLICGYMWPFGTRAITNSAHLHFNNLCKNPVDHCLLITDHQSLITAHPLPNYLVWGSRLIILKYRMQPQEYVPAAGYEILYVLSTGLAKNRRGR